ncbi:7TM GPCR protein [Aphelenchoides avenae]|nr:7TM GPCR protein [Aphelenchus avenae]
MVTNGWFANQNEIFDHVTLALYCAFLHTNIIIIVVQFVYRYRIICRNDSQDSFFRFLYLCPVLWCGLQVYNAFCCFVLGSSPESREVGLGILQDIGWNYDPSELPYPSVAHWSEVRTKMHHLMYLVSTVGGYSMIIVCQYRIMKYLKHYGSSMHETARQRHAYINKALVAMVSVEDVEELGLAVAPLLSSTGPSLTIIALMIFHQSPGSVTAFITLGTSLITLINPLTTIYFVRPFRDAVLAAFTVDKAKVASVNATSDGTTASNDEPNRSEP